MAYRALEFFITGFERHESKFMDRIVQEIWSKLPSKIRDEEEGLVGMKSHIEEVTLLLGEESNVVRTVGIWGLSGIGKSTLARAVYGQIKDRFEVDCFLDEVGETSKKGGLRSLQQHLLSETLGVKDLQIANYMAGIVLMKTRLRSRMVLLVLDDVDSSEQLEALAGSHEWFGPGSRIIITTRDRKLLVAHNEVQIYEARLLDDVEATKLFRWKAFNDNCPAEDFKDLSVQVIGYSGHLPLAIKVLGSALCGENLDFWKALLEKLRKVGPDSKIVEKLKIGFDGLEETVQNTFLDIACFFEARRKNHFFVGWKKEDVTRILSSFDFCPDHSITVLIHKSLIDFSKGLVCMHQLIREMGRHIVRQNFPRECGKYSRLWDTSDIEHVLTRNTGTENIEGILLNPEHVMPLEMGTKAFREMSKLRFLEIHNTCIPKGPDYLPNALRWIDWDEYPSNYLPTTFEADFLVGLRLHCSRLKQLWEGRTKKKMMKKLKYIDLSYSRNLVSISHLGEAYNLEELILQGCTSLVKVDQSIGFLKKLVSLNLAGCKNLVILPSTLCTLKRLKSLILSGCSTFEKLPEEIGNLECLEELLLDETAVTEPPPSIGNLKNLKNLSFGNSRSQSTTSILQSLFQLRKRQKTTRSVLLPPIWGLTSLKQLNLTDCNLSEGAIPGDLGSLFSLVELRLGGNNFENLPSLNQLSKLDVLVLNRCEMLGELPELPSRIIRLFANDCASLRVSADQLGTCKIKYGWFQNCRKMLDYGESEILANTLLQQNLQIGRRMSWIHWNLKNIILPGRVIPEWFCNHTFTEHLVSLKLPLNWYDTLEFKGYSFFVIWEAINKVKSCNFDDEIDHRAEIDLRANLQWLGMRYDGPITPVRVELSFTEPGHDHSLTKHEIFLWETDNITGLEHTIMGYQTAYSFLSGIKNCIDCRWKEHGGIEVGIKSLSPDTVVVKKWGVRLLSEDDGDDEKKWGY